MRIPRYVIFDTNTGLYLRPGGYIKGNNRWTVNVTEAYLCSSEVRAESILAMLHYNSVIPGASDIEVAFSQALARSEVTLREIDV